MTRRETYAEVLGGFITKWAPDTPEGIEDFGKDLRKVLAVALAHATAPVGRLVEEVRQRAVGTDINVIDFADALRAKRVREGEER